MAKKIGPEVVENVHTKTRTCTSVQVSYASLASFSCATVQESGSWANEDVSAHVNENNCIMKIIERRGLFILHHSILVVQQRIKNWVAQMCL